MGTAETARRRTARCIAPAPGFPMTNFRFTTLKQVREYLAGDEIQCLLCGRWLKTFARHLSLHGTNHKEYKRAFNLPTTYPLVGREVRRKLSEACILPPDTFAGSGTARWEGATGQRAPDYIRHCPWMRNQTRNHKGQYMKGEA